MIFINLSLAAHFKSYNEIVHYRLPSLTMLLNLLHDLLRELEWNPKRKGADVNCETANFNHRLKTFSTSKCHLGAKAWRILLSLLRVHLWFIWNESNNFINGWGFYGSGIVADYCYFSGNYFYHHQKSGKSFCS